jgi:hypothetical protein
MDERAEQAEGRMRMVEIQACHERIARNARYPYSDQTERTLQLLADLAFQEETILENNRPIAT